MDDMPSNERNVVDTLLMLPSGIDALDAKLIQAMCETPRAGVMELARQLSMARGTVQARLDKLQNRGIISGFDPDLDLQAMGYEVLAFVSLEYAQGRLDDVIEHLETIPEVLEAPARDDRPGDLHCGSLPARTRTSSRSLPRARGAWDHAHHDPDRPQRAGAPPRPPARRTGDRRGDRSPAPAAQALDALSRRATSYGAGSPRP